MEEKLATELIRDVEELGMIKVVEELEVVSMVEVIFVGSEVVEDVSGR